MFYELRIYEPNGRGKASQVVQLINPTKLISYFPLLVLQATAVEEHDEKLIEENLLISTAIMIFQIMIG